jgi:hypothetical protein
MECIELACVSLGVIDTGEVAWIDVEPVTAGRHPQENANVHEHAQVNNI